MKTVDLKGGGGWGGWGGVIQSCTVYGYIVVDAV